MNLPMAILPTPVTARPLGPAEIRELHEEVRALAAARDAVILAHNYQVPEVQDVADYVGDSLGLSQQAAKAGASTIAFCGVHFMAETASILCPDKRVLIPDPDAGCSLADSITPDDLRAWQARHPGAVTVMYVNTTAEIKALTDWCVTSSNAVAVVEHILRDHGPDTEILFGPDMFLGAYVEAQIGRKLHVWAGSATCTPGSGRPTSSACGRASRRRLPHPPGVRLLDLGDGVRRGRRCGQRGRAHALDRRDAALRRCRRARLDGDRGHGDRDAAPAAHGGARRRLHRGQRARELPLHEDDHPAEAARLPARPHRGGQGARGRRGARIPIERMVSIG